MGNLLYMLVHGVHSFLQLHNDVLILFAISFPIVCRIQFVLLAANEMVFS